MNMRKKIYQHPNMQVICLKQQRLLLTESATDGTGKKNSYGEETGWE